MGVALIITMFITNAIALDCLYNDRKKSAGALIIVNLCLTVALAYQFEQMQNVLYVFLGFVALVAVFFLVKWYITKKKSEPKVVEAEYIEDKNDEKEESKEEE